MARQSAAQRIAGMLMGTAGILLIAATIVIVLVRTYPLQIAALVLAGFGVRHVLKRRLAMRRERDFELARACADRQIGAQAGTLISYFRQSIRADMFGNEDISIWRRHLDTFLDTQVLPGLRASSIRLDSDLIARLADHVDAVIRSKSAEAALAGGQRDVDPAQLSAREYEQYCASILSRSGWKVQSTPVTGDRGADVVAEKEGRRLIVQCKLYSQPVGNKAVQEVYAARPLYNGDHACVVAPAGFTRQAECDAHALSVRLLHHSQLQGFAEELATLAQGWPKRAVAGAGGSAS